MSSREREGEGKGMGMGKEARAGQVYMTYLPPIRQDGAKARG